MYCFSKRKKKDEEDTIKETKKTYPWEMKNKLYTKEMVFNEFNIKELPDATQIAMDDRVCDYFTNSEKWNEIIKSTKWCKVTVFSKRSDNKKKNKRRKILKIIPDEFKKNLKYNKVVQVKQIPILLFKNNHPEIHNAIIVNMDNDYIGISLIYDEKINKVVVTGIHIDVSSLYEQYQWISSAHRKAYKYFHDLTTTIDHLEIGNIDDDKNTIYNLKSNILRLKTEKENLEKKLESFRDESATPSILTSSLISTSPSVDYKHSALDYSFDSSNASIYSLK